MKRLVRIVSLVLVIAALVTVSSVFAAASTVPVVYGVKMNTGYSATLACESGEVVNKSGLIDGAVRDAFLNVAKIELSFAGTAGKEYVVFLVKGSEADDVVVPSQNSIYYINQLTATGTDSATIYPKNLVDTGHYRIYLSSEAGYEEIGVLNVANSWEEYEYLLGDVDGNGKVNLADAYRALQGHAGLVDLNDGEILRGNVVARETTGVNLADAYNILKKHAGLSISVEEG